MIRSPYFISAATLDLVPASHEDPSDPGVFKKVLVGKGIVQQGTIQMVNFAMMPVGKKFNLHYHEDMDEVFILISGSATMRAGANHFEMHEFDTVVVPARCEHEMSNSGDTPVIYLVFGVSRGEGGKTINV
jgi:mannose-6-phosphate isomerase-like protein (cupin superfamily)